MGQTTTIEWTDRTWNPTRGCSRVSPGCVNCYAERLAARFSGGQADSACKEAAGMEPGGPFAGFALRTPSGPRWTGKVELVESKLSEPLHWRKPARIFVNSMSDLFHEKLSDEAIDRVFAVMALCPQHTFQVLTKRPERMLKYLQPGFQWQRVIDRCYEFTSAVRGFLPRLGSWPLANVWLGISIENQATADERIPLLLQTPAAVRFVSYEPALGPVDFRPFLPAAHYAKGEIVKAWSESLDQIIVGGESGPGARPFDIAWARSARDQCKAAGVACSVKQLGTDPREPSIGFWPGQGNMTAPRLNDRKGGDMNEWPEDLRIREFPGSQSASQEASHGGRPEQGNGPTGHRVANKKDL